MSSAGSAIRSVKSITRPILRLAGSGGEDQEEKEEEVVEEEEVGSFSTRAATVGLDLGDSTLSVIRPHGGFFLLGEDGEKKREEEERMLRWRERGEEG